MRLPHRPEVIAVNAILADNEAHGCAIKENSEETAGGMPEMDDENRRISMLTAGLKTYGSRKPDARRIYVDSFVDAYRFWIRLCGQHGFSCRYHGGHVDYTAVTKDKTTMCLTDGTRRDDTVATLNICGAAYRGKVREIKFILNEKQTEYENNKVRIHRKRGVTAKREYGKKWL